MMHEANKKIVQKEKTYISFVIEENETRVEEIESEKIPKGFKRIAWTIETNETSLSNGK